FGGNWGAFDTTGMHFFNERHSIYKGIQRIAQVRAQEPVLRYGRQYFREISGNGKDFGPPGDSNCFVAFSRVLDTTEMLVVFNLMPQAQEYWVLVDSRLTPPRRRMTNLLREQTLEVKRLESGVAAVHVPMGPREISILK